MGVLSPATNLRATESMRPSAPIRRSGRVLWPFSNHATALPLVSRSIATARYPNSTWIPARAECSSSTACRSRRKIVWVGYPMIWSSSLMSRPPKESPAASLRNTDTGRPPAAAMSSNSPNSCSTKPALGQSVTPAPMVAGPARRSYTRGVCPCLCKASATLNPAIPPPSIPISMPKHSCSSTPDTPSRAFI
ncbi:hypothetical protein D9M69_480800 [compost metagenome]